MVGYVGCVGEGVVMCLFFFFNDTAPTEIYTLSLHDALPILLPGFDGPYDTGEPGTAAPLIPQQDRKSTRLNSSHGSISYAVFCLKQQKKSYTGSAIVVVFYFTYHLIDAELRS